MAHPKRFTHTLLLAACLAAFSTTTLAEEVRDPGEAVPKPTPSPVVREPGTPMPKPRPGTPPSSTRIDLSPAHRYADRGDARTLQQAQAYADAGDARTLDAAHQHSAALVVGLQREDFAGIAQAAALVPMEPNGDGETTLNVGAATYGGQTALGLAFSHQIGSTVVNAGVGFGSNGSKRTLVRVGLGWRF